MDAQELPRPIRRNRHDSEAILYSVPAEVAANLDQYCLDFSNSWAFPNCQSRQIKALGCYDYEIPDVYQHYPRYNF
jgi:hypothetical protein